MDLTLEQTINVDAASRLSGITSATNNYTARLCWMITKSTRDSFMSLVQEMAGLVTKDDTTTELTCRWIERDAKDLRSDDVNKTIMQSFPSRHGYRVVKGIPDQYIHRKGCQ